MQDHGHFRLRFSRQASTAPHPHRPIHITSSHTSITDTTHTSAPYAPYLATAEPPQTQTTCSTFTDTTSTRLHKASSSQSTSLQAPRSPFALATMAGLGGGNNGWPVAVGHPHCKGTGAATRGPCNVPFSPGPRVTLQSVTIPHEVRRGADAGGHSPSLGSPQLAEHPRRSWLSIPIAAG